MPVHRTTVRWQTKALSLRLQSCIQAKCANALSVSLNISLYLVKMLDNTAQCMGHSNTQGTVVMLLVYICQSGAIHSHPGEAHVHAHRHAAELPVEDWPNVLCSGGIQLLLQDRHCSLVRNREGLLLVAAV